MARKKTPDDNSSPITEPGIAADAGAVDSLDGDSPAVDSLEFLRGLAQIVRDEKLSELTVEQGGVRIFLRSRLAPLSPLGAPAEAEAPSEATIVESGAWQDDVTAIDEVAEQSLTPIVSPMVGVFYRSPSPDDPPYVEVGDAIEIGQAVGMIEAMKVFNDITSEIAGTVVEIRAQNAQLVETGAPLVMLRTE